MIDQSPMGEKLACGIIDRDGEENINEQASIE
jgi:hypothetical protein